jgi:glycosyltransferase involved in cell wall biosynthesis
MWNYHDILVIPSRHEGLPIAAVEAMMCHRPVLATDVGGNAEVIRDGETGFIAESPSLAALDRALERVWMLARPSASWSLPDPKSSLLRGSWRLRRNASRRAASSCLQSKDAGICSRTFL